MLSPQNLRPTKKDVKLGFKISQIPFFSTLSLDLLEVKTKQLDQLITNPRLFKPSYEALVHLSLTRDILFGIHSTLKRPHLHAFQAGLLFKNPSFESESIFLMNGQLQTDAP